MQTTREELESKLNLIEWLTPFKASYEIKENGKVFVQLTEEKTMTTFMFGGTWEQLAGQLDRFYMRKTKPHPLLS